MDRVQRKTCPSLLEELASYSELYNILINTKQFNSLPITC